MATIVNPLFELSDLQEYTGSTTDIPNFNQLYDMAWNYLIEFCPSLAQVDDSDPNLEWLKKAMMLQIQYLNANYETLINPGRITRFQIGDYSESYSYGGSYTKIPTLNPGIINWLMNYFGCSVWLKRQACFTCGCMTGCGCK